MAWGAAGSTQPVLKPWLKQKWVTSQKRWQPKYRTSSQDSAATGRWKQPWSASWSAKWPGKCSPGSNWSARRRPTVPLTFAVDKEARYTGTVEVFYKWRGFGWISLDEKGVVPNDSLFVQWNNIQTEDRYPYLEKGMQVEFGIMKWREEKAAMSLMAKFVTIPGGATVALQDADDERSKTFFGSSTSRYKGKLDWYSPKSGLGWVTVLDDSLQGSPVPKEIRVDREEMNCGGKRAGNWIENVVVEFGIHQLQNGTYTHERARARVVVEEARESQRRKADAMAANVPPTDEEDVVAGLLLRESGAPAAAAATRPLRRLAAPLAVAAALVGVYYLETADPAQSQVAATWQSGMRANVKRTKRLFGFCTDCCGTTCSSCLADDMCNWCPETNDCHAVGSVADQCAVPIDTQGQCWGQSCPYQIGDFLNDRADDTKEWGLQSSQAATTPLLDFQTYFTSCGTASGECLSNINWAMQTGINQHPDWYPGLTAASPAADFQQLLAMKPGTQCPSPCDPNITANTGVFDLSTGQPTTASGGSPINEDFVIAVVGDWGSGTCVAKVVGTMMAQTNPKLTFHLGDVYFVATEAQYGTNVAGQARYSWQQEGVFFPKGSVATFLMTGNHELISGMSGLFQSGFYYSGQTASYGAWQSDSWRFIAIDTGYLSYETLPVPPNPRNLMAETNAPMPSQVVEWLQNVVNIGDPDDKRGIVLFSHHQPVSAWDTAYVGAAQQLQELLPSGKTVVWLFGHMHALVLYGKSQLQGMDYSFYPRLIGNGGFPNEMPPLKDTSNVIAVDQRIYQEIPAVTGMQKIGYNGYVKLTVNGPQLNVDYITANCAGGNCQEGLDAANPSTIASETFNVDLTTGAISQEWSLIGEELTKYQEPAADAANVECDAPPLYGQGGINTNNGMD
eukprot:TRINITY_DN3960_c0_g1_i3.p1 TRINITY_DN3960_c0_g1~~TRINITY_DN3960_c0_g1_i3.p1  ORF type:complete len:927 (-),score=157.34 TRINITY_DN3960_c0_g1_i3:228-2942(-)